MKNFSERLFAHLAHGKYVPASAVALAKQWRLPTKQRRAFLAEVGQLVRAGQIAVIKGDRLCIPQAASLVTGKINFRQKGSAMVTPEGKATESRKPAIFIAAEDTGTALQGEGRRPPALAEGA